jgi:hypothetical protein
MTRRRLVLLAALPFAMLALNPPAAQAREYPWCHITTGLEDGGVWNCMYDSYAQCAWASMGGEMCNINPRHNPQKPEPRPRKKQRQRQQ